MCSTLEESNTPCIITLIGRRHWHGSCASDPVLVQASVVLSVSDRYYPFKCLFLGGPHNVHGICAYFGVSLHCRTDEKCVEDILSAAVGYNVKKEGKNRLNLLQGSDICQFSLFHAWQAVSDRAMSPLLLYDGARGRMCSRHDFIYHKESHFFWIHSISLCN